MWHYNGAELDSIQLIMWLLLAPELIKAFHELLVEYVLMQSTVTENKWRMYNTVEFLHAHLCPAFIASESSHSRTTERARGGGLEEIKNVAFEKLNL